MIKETINTSITFPVPVYEEIKLMAQNDERSINSMVNILIREALKRGMWSEVIRRLDEIERYVKK